VRYCTKHANKVVTSTCERRVLVGAGQGRGESGLRRGCSAFAVSWISASCKTKSTVRWRGVAWRGATRRGVAHLLDCSA
jgi:hypothetical protein